MSEQLERSLNILEMFRITGTSVYPFLTLVYVVHVIEITIRAVCRT